MTRHYPFRQLDPTATDAQRDRATRLMHAERRLNEALKHLEELLRTRRELDRTSASDAVTESTTG